MRVQTSWCNYQQWSFPWSPSSTLLFIVYLCNKKMQTCPDYLLSSSVSPTSSQWDSCLEAYSSCTWLPCFRKATSWTTISLELIPNSYSSRQYSLYLRGPHQFIFRNYPCLDNNDGNLIPLLPQSIPSYSLRDHYYSPSLSLPPSLQILSNPRSSLLSNYVFFTLLAKASSEGRLLHNSLHSKPFITLTRFSFLCMFFAIIIFSHLSFTSPEF